MRLFLISPIELTKFKGAPKGYIEIGEALQRRGVDCTVFGPEHLNAPTNLQALPWKQQLTEFPKYLRQFMLDRRDEFDAIEFEHYFLPFPAQDVCPEKLKVVRCSILTYQLEHYRLPSFGGLRPILSKIKNAPRTWSEERMRYRCADITCRNADLVNVPNEYDKQRLLSLGFPEEKITVVPYGLTSERIDALASVKPGTADKPVISFVGTFDARKGGVEMPHIFGRILAKFPNAQFRLLGTKGLFQTAEQVYSKFPGRLHKSIEIVPSFSPESLLDLLNGSTVGIFPSHLESFGFGVLEMIAAGIPVVAYDVPGPPVMLRNDMLVPKGDWKSLADKVITWLENPDQLAVDSAWGRQRVHDFHYDITADKTFNAYSQALERKQASLRNS